MVDYNKIQTKVARKLIKVGMSLTITITQSSDYVASSDSYSKVIVRKYPVHGIRRAYTDKEISSGILQGNTSKSLIQVGDVEFMISIESGLPLLNDEQEIKILEDKDTIEWTVIRVKPLAPSDTILFYKLHATRRSV